MSMSTHPGDAAHGYAIGTPVMARIENHELAGTVVADPNGRTAYVHVNVIFDGSSVYIRPENVRNATATEMRECFATFRDPWGREAIVTDKTGQMLERGSEVTNFRGETGSLSGVSRLAEPGKSAKITLEYDSHPGTLSEVYASVCNLTVTGIKD